MLSHKGPLVAQGNGAPGGNRAADTVELAELGARVEKTGKRAISNPTKAEEEQAYPGPQEAGEEVGAPAGPPCHGGGGACARGLVLEGHPIRRAWDWLKDSNFLLHGHRLPCPPSGPASGASSSASARRLATSGPSCLVLCFLFWES